MYLDSTVTTEVTKMSNSLLLLMKQLLMLSDGSRVYLIGLLPALNAATVRGPQVTAPPLGSYCRQVAGIPRGRAVQMPGCRPSPPSGEGGTTRDRSVMEPLGWVVVTVGVLMMRAEGTWHLPTVLPSMQVCEATLLFAQVSSHTAATQH